MTRIYLPIPLDQVHRVTFFKRDEIASDLICCEIASSDEHWLFHEEMEGWQELIVDLDALPNFRADWYAAVSQPAFAPAPMIAYDRSAP